jgi:hypothetical protein
LSPTSSHQDRPSHAIDNPVSRPDVAKSQNGGTASTTKQPAGASQAAPPYRRRVPSMATPNPSTDRMSPPYTASLATSCPESPAATTSHVHSTLVLVSARSPML